MRTEEAGMSNFRRPSSTAGTGDIKCPYFVAHSDTEIVCEGLIDRCRAAMRFRDPDDKKFHKETFCENQYKRCEMYISTDHWKYWEEDQE